MKSPTENKIRLTAFFVLLLVLAYIQTGQFIFPFILTIDFALRGLGYGSYSLLGNAAGYLAKVFRLKEKPVYFPPKQFAARIGLLFSLILLILNVLKINSLPVSIVLAVCAGLEAFFNYCVGCKVFNLIQTYRNRK